LDFVDRIVVIVDMTFSYVVMIAVDADKQIGMVDKLV